MSSQRLLEAASGGDVAVFIRQLRRRPDHVNRGDPVGGWTALHLAAWSNHFPIAAVALYFGADVMIENNEKLAPVEIAEQRKNTSISAFLRMFTRPMVRRNTSLQEVVRSNSDPGADGEKASGPPEEMVNRRVTSPPEPSRTASVKKPAKDGWTTLMWLVMRDEVEGIQAMLGAAAQSSVNEKNKAGMTALHIAVHWGRSSLIELLLEAGAELAALDKLGSSVLHYACVVGHAKILHRLMQAAMERAKDSSLNSMKINGPNKLGMTPLHLACLKGHVECVQILLSMTPNVEQYVDIGDCVGDTALHMALMHSPTQGHVTHQANLATRRGTSASVARQGGNRMSIVTMLAENKATLYVIADPGWTTLMQAAVCNDWQTASLIIERHSRAIVNETTKEGETALHWAAYHNSMETCIVLIENGADLSIATKGKVAALACDFARNDDMSAFLKNQLALQKGMVFKDESAVTFARDKREDMKLTLRMFEAAEKNEVAVVIQMLDRGVDIECVTQDLWRPIHVAAHAGAVDVVEHLLKNGTHLDDTTNEGRTPLHLAALREQTACAKLLLNAGAKTDMVDKDGLTAQQLAENKGFAMFAREIARCAAGTRLTEACQIGDMDWAKLVLQQKPSFQMRNAESGNGPLHAAIVGGYTELVDLLIKEINGVKDNLDYPNRTGNTAFHLAAAGDRQDYALKLLDGGADCEKTNDEGKTALEVAAALGFEAFVAAVEAAKRHKAAEDSKYYEEDTAMIRFKPRMPGEVMAIVAGTIEALTERLVHEKYADMKYFPDYFFTYPAFTTPKMILTILRARFNMAPTSSSDLAAVEEEIQRLKVMRLRTVSVLKYWLTARGHDFLSNTELVADLRQFLEDDVLRLMGAPAKVLITKLERVLSHLDIQSTPPLVPVSATIAQEGVPIVDILAEEPATVAAQLTLMEHDSYCLIETDECLHQSWAKIGKETKSPNLVRHIAAFNNISSWVSTRVLKPDTPPRRAAVIEFFIRLGSAFLELNNFNGLMEIVAGLGSTPVFRLRATWELVTKKRMAELGAIRAVMSADGNFRAYRQRLHTISPPTVPYMGRYLSDLTFIDDGNVNVTADGLINFNKWALTGKVLAEIRQYQLARYTNLPLHPPLLAALAKIEGDNEGTLYERSLLVEPRVERNNTPQRKTYDGPLAAAAAAALEAGSPSQSPAPVVRPVTPDARSDRSNSTEAASGVNSRKASESVHLNENDESGEKPVGGEETPETPALPAPDGVKGADAPVEPQGTLPSPPTALSIDTSSPPAPAEISAAATAAAAAAPTPVVEPVTPVAQRGEAVAMAVEMESDRTERRFSILECEDDED